MSDVAEQPARDPETRRRPNGLGPLGRWCPVCKVSAGQRCIIDGRAATSVYQVHRARQG